MLNRRLGRVVLAGLANGLRRLLHRNILRVRRRIRARGRVGSSGRGRRNLDVGDRVSFDAVRMQVMAGRRKEDWRY